MLPQANFCEDLNGPPHQDMHISNVENAIKTKDKKKGKVVDFDSEGLFMENESLGLSRPHEQLIRVVRGLPPKDNNRVFQQSFSTRDNSSTLRLNSLNSHLDNTVLPLVQSLVKSSFQIRMCRRFRKMSYKHYQNHLMILVGEGKSIQLCWRFQILLRNSSDA